MKMSLNSIITQGWVMIIRSNTLSLYSFANSFVILKNKHMITIYNGRDSITNHAAG